MIVPSAVRSFVTQEFGESGQAWLDRLPGIYKALACRWRLRNPTPLSGGQIGLVYRVDSPEGPRVLKLSYPAPEFRTEVRAMLAFAEHGGVRPIAVDWDHVAVLMPLIQPGEDLTGLPDSAAVAIAAEAMRRFRRAAPSAGFATLEAWFGELLEAEADVKGMPVHLVAQYREIVPMLLETTTERVLLHGDLHHYNILRDGDDWTVIDPKGVIGDPVYEPSNFLRNPIGLEKSCGDLPAILVSRIRGFAEALGYPVERIWAWGFAMTVLSAWWDPVGPSRDGTLQIAAALAELGLG